MASIGRTPFQIGMSSKCSCAPHLLADAMCLTSASRPSLTSIAECAISRRREPSRVRAMGKKYLATPSLSLRSSSLSNETSVVRTSPARKAFVAPTRPLSHISSPTRAPSRRRALPLGNKPCAVTAILKGPFERLPPNTTELYSADAIATPCANPRIHARSSELRVRAIV